MSDGKDLPGYQDIGCHMIFVINMDGNFTREARFVASGHTTDPPASTTYSSVVFMDSVQIAFMIAALNDMYVFSANITNVYLNGPCCETILTKDVPEFGSQQGCFMLIVRALYGLKSRGAYWGEMLVDTLGTDGLGYTSTATDKDVWIKREFLPDGK